MQTTGVSYTHTYTVFTQRLKLLTWKYLNYTQKGCCEQQSTFKVQQFQRITRAHVFTGNILMRQIAIWCARWHVTFNFANFCHSHAREHKFVARNLTLSSSEELLWHVVHKTTPHRRRGMRLLNAFISLIRVSFTVYSG